MSSRNLVRPLRNSHLFVWIPALLVGIIASCILLIWGFGHYYMVPMLGHHMQQNVVIGLLLLVLSIALLKHKPHREYKIVTGKIFAFLVLVLGAITFYEHVAQVDLGIDQFFLIDLDNEQLDYMGRMAPQVALCFIFLGEALLLTSYNTILQKISHAFNAGVFLISVLSLMGHLYGAPVLYQVGEYVRISELASACLLLLSIAVFFLRPQNDFVITLMSHSSAGVFARRVLIATVLLPPTIGFLGLELLQARHVNQSVSFAVVAVTSLVTFIFIIWQSSTAVSLADESRRGSERDRLKSIAHIDALLSCAPLGIGFLDHHLRIVKVNEFFTEACEMQSYNPVGMLLKDVGSQMAKTIEPYVLKALQKNEPIKNEITLVKPDGHIHYFSASFFPVETIEGESLGVGISLQNINELKKTEAELIAARDLADEASRAKSFFLANMSHEIRTPVGVIMGFIDLLNKQDLSEAEAENHRAVIQRNCRQLLRIIDDILDLSKVEAGKLSLHKELVSVRELFNDLKTILEQKAQAKKIQFEMIILNEVPSKIFSDSARIRQVILNIAGNALKFTSEGSVKMTVFSEKQKLFVRISDTGKGIASHQKHRLFKPFSQADSSTTRLYGGNGLGLSLSQKLARALGGDIVLEKTVPEKGSDFLISFDIGVVDKISYITEADFHQSAALKPSLTPEVLERIKDKKVLVVDDSPDNQLLVSVLLRNAGAKVDTAADGKAGIDKTLKGSYDLVLMDIQMPVMDGYEAVQKLRKVGYKKPVVALTAHAMRGEREKCISMGYTSYITKPIDRLELLEIVSQS